MQVCIKLECDHVCRGVVTAWLVLKQQTFQEGLSFLPCDINMSSELRFAAIWCQEHCTEQCTKCCWLAGQVLGGEEILQLPKKTEELVPGRAPGCLQTPHLDHAYGMQQDPLLRLQLCSVFAAFQHHPSRQTDTCTVPLECISSVLECQL